MVVKMKRYEQLAIEYAKKFKPWDSQIIAKDAYMEAYRQAAEDINATADYCNADQRTEYDFYVGDKEVEVTFEPGTHQLMDDQSIRKSRGNK